MSYVLSCETHKPQRTHPGWPSFSCSAFGGWLWGSDACLQLRRVARIRNGRWTRAPWFWQAAWRDERSALGVFRIEPESGVDRSPRDGLVGGQAALIRRAPQQLQRRTVAGVCRSPLHSLAQSPCSSSGFVPEPNTKTPVSPIEKDAFPWLLHRCSVYCARRALGLVDGLSVLRPPGHYYYDARMLGIRSGQVRAQGAVRRGLLFSTLFIVTVITEFSSSLLPLSVLHAFVRDGMTALAATPSTATAARPSCLI
jgi:hypothetical protein